MFKQSAKLLTSASLKNSAIILRQKMRFGSTIAAKKHKWDLLSGVCLERHPVITKPMTDLEKRFQDTLDKIEFENSMKSDYELRAESEYRQQELQKKGLLDVDIDMTISESALDIEDIGKAELAAFNFAPCITEADKKNIKTSLDRKLDKCLLLLVEQSIGQERFWLPPQGIRNEGETMRQAAERVLRETCGDDLNVRIYGNAPMGFYKYVYPKTVQEEGSHGAKIFYYLAKYVKGSVPEKIKHQWLDREELKNIMPQPVHKSVSMLFLQE